MTNWKLLAAALIFNLSVTQAFANAENSQAPEDQILARLFTDPTVKVRASDSAWPADIAVDATMMDSDRSPASAKKPAGKLGSSQQSSRGTTAMAVARRSRLPAAVADGFELQVRYNKLTSMFWIMKREQNHSLLFSNSSGSRASLEMSPDNFALILKKAREFPSLNADISKCKDANMQMHIVTGGRERTFAACVNSKEKMAAQMRDFSQAIAGLVM